MSEDKNYGQHTTKLDNLKSKLGGVDTTTHPKLHHTVQLEPDCISCQKERLKRIPNNKQCQVICGKKKSRLTTND